jgi:AcrR family transcriptional regulator
VADEVGLANLTLTAIAPRLGVRMPSLYKHVASADALKRLVSIRATREMADVFARAAVGKSEADALAAIAGAWREWANAHPGRYAATVRAPARGDAEHTAAADDALRIVLAALAGYALRGDDAIDAARAFRSTLHGFISLEQAGAFGLPVDIDRSFDRLVAGLSGTLRSWTQG